MKYTDKTKVTKTEYLQLIRLLTLAQANNEKQKDIHKAVMVITGEKDDMGHSSDAVYTDIGADELLESSESR